MIIEHPYNNLTDGQWLAGNLHAHTVASDVQRQHQQVIDDYARCGHGFLMISDHDTCIIGAGYECFNAQGMILVLGHEISADGPHLLRVGARHRVEPHGNRQEVVDEVAASGDGFPLFNHPNRGADFSYCPQESLDSCEGCVGLEIYNAVSSRLQGSP